MSILMDSGVHYNVLQQKPHLSLQLWDFGITIPLYSLLPLGLGKESPMIWCNLVVGFTC